MKNWMLLAVLGLAGCQSLPVAQDQRTPLVQTGEQLVLERNLRVPPFGEMLYIQQGEPLSARDIVEVEPYCILRMRTTSDDYRNLLPDTFTISNVRYSQDDYGFLAGRMLAYNDSGGPTQWFYRVDLELQSPVQPDVMRLTCQVDRYQASGMAMATLVSRREVESALRGLLRFADME